MDVQDFLKQVFGYGAGQSATNAVTGTLVHAGFLSTLGYLVMHYGQYITFALPHWAALLITGLGYVLTEIVRRSQPPASPSS
jgi:uncharacterized ion transporter superfamily protein YfcC